MWRALFGAIGFMLCIVGGELLLVDEAVLADDIELNLPTQQDSLDLDDFDSYLEEDGLELFDSSGTASGKRIIPPDWAPWSLLASGGVVLLYAIGLRSGSS